VIVFERNDRDGCFEPEGPGDKTMQEIARKKWPNRFDEIDRDLQLKQILDSLETENSLLKGLVVRLSETIIRNVTAKR
jgi:hypothetical protein